MKKSLAVVLFLTLPIFVFCQRPSQGIMPDSDITFNKGIYLGIDEFLSNNPSIPYHFEVHNHLTGYYGQPEERNDYILSYYDDMGYTKVLRANEIWGYCTGNQVYITFQGKPYELVHLGAISLLRYNQHNHRPMVAEMFSLYALGFSIVGADKAQELLFDVKNDSVIIPTNKNIRKLIEDDTELFAEYKKDKKTDYFQKNLTFLQRYNEKYPLTFTDEGFSFIKVPSADNDALATRDKGQVN